jgi:hypothetical protein
MNKGNVQQREKNALHLAMVLRSVAGLHRANSLSQLLIRDMLYVIENLEYMLKFESFNRLM